MNELKTGIGKRIAERRKQLGLSQAELARKLGMNSSTIWRYERGEIGADSIKLPVIESMAMFLKVNPAWLVGKTEIMEPSNLLPLNETEQTNINKLNAHEKKHIEKYRSLDTSGKKIVDIVLDNECERMEKPEMIHIPYMEYEMEHEMEEPQEMIDIDYSYARVSAGIGIMLNDDEEIIKIKIPLTDESRRADFAVSVRGDSMEPIYCDGDLLLVRRQPAIDPGEIGIFIVNNEGFVKKLGQGELISLNDKYENIPLHEYDEIRCIGKIEGAIPENEAKHYIF